MDLAVEIEEDVAAEELEVVAVLLGAVGEEASHRAAQRAGRRSLSSHTDILACSSREAKRISS